MLISRRSDDLKNVEEQIDNVKVEVEGGKDVLLWVQRVLWIKYAIKSFRSADAD